MAAAMCHIGLDLDNTIIDYSEAFGSVGIHHGLLPREQVMVSKNAAKDYLLAQPNGMHDWMRLQGLVYGPQIHSARLYDGVEKFVLEADRRGHRISIVSHKTEKGHFDTSGTSLHDAALSFLRAAGLVGRDGTISEDDVHFLSTRDAKVRRIGEIGCDVFVDDLPEVLLHPEFPRGTKPVWFAEPTENQMGLTAVNNWDRLHALLE